MLSESDRREKEKNETGVSNANLYYLLINETATPADNGAKKSSAYSFVQCTRAPVCIQVSSVIIAVSAATY